MPCSWTPGRLWWHVVLLLSLATLPAYAGLFNRKRFKYEGLIRIGNLGIDDGRIAAWGDADGDQFTDAFVLNDQGSTVFVRRWNHEHFAFEHPPGIDPSFTNIHLPGPGVIQNVVSTDINHDGIIDLVLMSAPQSDGIADTLNLYAYLGRESGGFDPVPIELPSTNLAHPVLFDATGDLSMDFLGHTPGYNTPLVILRNQMEGRYSANSTHPAFVPEKLVLLDQEGNPTQPKCQLTSPHSSSFVDLNGDCVAGEFLLLSLWCCSDPNKTNQRDCCSTDLFLTCLGKQFMAPSYEIWTARRTSVSFENNDTAYFQRSRTGDLPAGSGMVSFADLNRDGTIDLVFGNCDEKECYINIVYNRQVGLCTLADQQWAWPWNWDWNWRHWLPFNSQPAEDLSDSTDEELRCRDPQRLCRPDPQFALDLDRLTRNGGGTGSRRDRRIPISQILGPGWMLLLSDTSVLPSLPISFSVGDYNKDGYPDLLITAKKEFQGGSVAVLLENVACGQAGLGVAGCGPGRGGGDDWKEERTFIPAPQSEILSQVQNVVGVSFVDLDEDGTLDLMLQTVEIVEHGAARPPTVRRRPTFVQNNLFFDSFFLKLSMLNGACDGECEPRNKSLQPFKPWGVNYAGASYKFTVLDTNGIRRAQAATQYSQTGYGSLVHPNSYLGLGRTNNYVESIQMGSSRRLQPQPRGRHHTRFDADRRANNTADTSSLHARQIAFSADDDKELWVRDRKAQEREANEEASLIMSMEGVIPNSLVFINPWDPPGTAVPSPITWGKEMYLRPGDWIAWVTVVLGVFLLMLAGIVLLLHFHEKVRIQICHTCQPFGLVGSNRMQSLTCTHSCA